MDFSSYLSLGLLQSALLCVLLLSPAAGIAGSIMVSRRLSYLGGAVAHFVLGGIGVARFLQVRCELPWLEPTWGAYVFALAGAAWLGSVSRRHPERIDAATAGLWAFGMALGVVFLSLTPGYAQDLMTYLFGNLLLVTGADMLQMAILDVALILLVVFYYRRLVGVSFDEEFCRIQGLGTQNYERLFIAVVAVTVVMLSRVVGLVLVMAVLTLPAVMAMPFVRRFGGLILVSSLACFVLSTIGVLVSFAANIPSGASIVMVLSVSWFVCLARSRESSR